MFAGENEHPLKRKVFSKLLGLFALLLVFHAVVIEILFHRIVSGAAQRTEHVVGQEAMLSGLAALALALLLAAWFSHSISRRLRRMVDFALQIAEGHLDARIDEREEDELTMMAQALNVTAARLEASFAELDNRRRELAALLDSMQEAVVAISAERRVSWSNAVMQKMVGTQIREGASLASAVRDPEVLLCAEGALGGGAVTTGRAIAFVPGRVFEVNAAPTPGGGAVVVLHDVTAVESAEKSRRDFIANVSHELRTPLTSISGYVETLLEETASSSQTTREFLSIILKNAHRMNRLTEDLLQLAGIESKDYQLKLRTMKADQLLEAAVDSLAGMVVESEVALKTCARTQAFVLVDEDALTQVFGNLIENAMKYGRSDGGILLSVVERTGEVEFSVQDFGPGIASDHLERIFERFYRVDKARSRESGGTGLGLAIAKHIVQAHGGRIWAESELGSGTTFRFTIPVVSSTAKQKPNLEEIEDSENNPNEIEEFKRL